MAGIVYRVEAEVAAFGRLDFVDKGIANGAGRRGIFGGADIEDAGELREIVGHE